MSGRVQDGQKVFETLLKGAADRAWFMRYEVNSRLRWDPGREVWTGEDLRL